MAVVSGWAANAGRPGSRRRRAPAGQTHLGSIHIACLTSFFRASEEEDAGPE